MRSLIQRINKLDTVIQNKISEHVEKQTLLQEFNKVQKLCRDSGELYGYSRLVDRDTIDKNHYKVVSGRIRHLEMCHNLQDRRYSYGE